MSSGTRSATCKILDHSPRFWALVERHWPSYREERAWLSRNGATLIL